MSKSSGRRTAFLGGSFDPPHTAHVLLARYALSTGEVDEVLIAPVFEHPFGKRLAPFADRLQMCELAFADVAQAHVSAIEQQMPRPNRTLFTLEKLQQERPGDSLRLVIGSDVLGDVSKWHAFEQVTRLAPLLVAPRAGYAEPGAVVLPDVSSTQIRELFAQRDEASLKRLTALIPRAVLDYALAHDLYR